MLQQLEYLNVPTKLIIFIIAFFAVSNILGEFLKFKGMDSINDIEKYKGKDLFVTREHAVKLEEGEYFIADLIGLNGITDEGEDIGILSDVIKTGANDVYVFSKEGMKELLVPKIPDCVKEVNLEEGTILIHLLKGLRD